MILNSHNFQRARTRRLTVPQGSVSHGLAPAALASLRHGSMSLGVPSAPRLDVPGRGFLLLHRSPVQEDGCGCCANASR